MKGLFVPFGKVQRNDLCVAVFSRSILATSFIAFFPSFISVGVVACPVKIVFLVFARFGRVSDDDITDDGIADQ